MTTVPSDPDGSDVDSGAVTAAVEDLRRRRDIPAVSLAVAGPGGVRFAVASGTADLATGRPATVETSYLWFSLTKVVTATAAMRLADEGRLDLDSPVEQHVPGVRPDHDGTRATVRNLLNHTAGLANPLPLRWVRPAGRPATPPAEFVARRLARHAKPKHRIGHDARYSNLGYLVLGQVIAAAAGQPYEQYVADAVLRPAGMLHTGFTHHPDRPPATGYLRAPRAMALGLRAILPSAIVGDRHGRHTGFRPFYVEGASYGGLVGDVVDAARLATLHLADGTIDGNRILQPATARAMREITTRGKPRDHGTGWSREPEHRNLVPGYVQHLGGGGGFFNVMRLYPEHGIGIVVMTNTTRAFPYHEFLEAVRRAA